MKYRVLKKKNTLSRIKYIADKDDLDVDYGSIHYTIAKFYRINGGSTQLNGVTPDIELPTLIDVTELGERTEPNALRWDKIYPAEYNELLDNSQFVSVLTHNYQERVKEILNLKLCTKKS